MTEKRYKLHDDYHFEYGVEDTYNSDRLYLDGFDLLVDELNALNDENEQLKQFKEDVFAKIDMHLRMLPTARDNEFNEDDGDPSLFTGAIYMLETLKKELEE